MTIAGFRFKPTLVPSSVFVLLFALLLGLGGWQLDRAEQKQRLIEAHESASVQMTLDLNWRQEMMQGDRYRPVLAKGRFDDRHQWLQDNQVYKGRAGYHVYSLFVPTGSVAEALLVNRGWVPVGQDRAVLPDLPVPAGEVVLHGHLDHPASVGIAMGDLSFRRDTAVSVHPFMDISALTIELGRPLFPLAMVLDEGEPGALTKDWSPAMQMGPEKHLGYALQWFSLALALMIIFVGVNAERIKK